MQKKAVIYARFSSANQQETSITGQLRVCNEYAERNGIEVIDTYIDRAFSGRTDNRPQFQQMLEDSKQENFSIILVYKVDRFARDRYISAVYKKQLKDRGVEVVSCTEHIEKGANGIIMEGILESFAEWYSINLSENIRRGITENTRQHLCLGGPPPLGFKFVDKKFTIDKDNAKIIKIIFNMFANGKGKQEICKYLNNNGYRTTKGCKFRLQSVDKILRNKKYAGYYIVKSSNIEIKNAIPKIIDEEIFNKCQYILTHKTVHHKSVGKYILTDKLFCQCGGKMIGSSGYSRHGKLYKYYRCNNKCSKNVPKKSIEDKVIDLTIHHILSEKMKKQITDKIFEYYNNAKKEDNTKPLKNKIKENKKKINNLLASLENGIYSDAIKERLNSLEDENNKLYTNLKKTEQNKAKSISKEDIKRTLDDFSSFDLKDEKERKNLIDVFIKKIELSENKIKIQYKLGDKKTCSYNLLNGGALFISNEIKIYINEYLNIILENSI